MARVTVEDCIVKVPNRFELVLLAAQRSRDISGGAEVTVERENDRNPVIALREIAEETVPLDDLRQSLVSGLQKHVEIDEPEDDGMEILAAAGKEWAEVTGGDTADATRETADAESADSDQAEAEAEAPELETAADSDSETPAAESGEEAEDEDPTDEETSQSSGS